MITVAGGAAKLLALLAVPILTPLLGPAPYGMAALIGTVIALASILALLGIDMAYARFYLQEDKNQREAVQRFCWRFAATGAVVVSLLTAGGWYWLGARWVDDHRGVAAYSVVAIGLSSAVVMMTTRIRLLGNYWRIGAALFLAAVASTVVSIGLAFVWRTDVWVLLFGTIAASVTSLLILGLPSSSFLLKASHLPLHTKRAVISLGAAGSVTAPMYWVISSSDRWFLSYYTSAAEVGVYAVASSVAMVGLMLNSSLTLTWFPEASRLYGERGAEALPVLARIWARLVAGLAVAWLIVAAAGGDVLRLLAAPAFHPGGKYVPWLAGGVFFYGLASLANTAPFLTAKMQLTAYIWTVVAFLSVAINFALIPHHGALGAAIVQCTSYGLITVGILAVSHYLLPLPIPLLRLSFGLVITLSAGVVMAPEWAESPVWSLALKLPVGLMVAGVVFMVIAPDWCRRALGAFFPIVASRKS